MDKHALWIMQCPLGDWVNNNIINSNIDSVHFLMKETTHELGRALRQPS